MQVCKPCHYALIEAVEPFKLHPMSMSYIYEVFEHLLRLWMGILLHIHIITTTDASPDLWELAKIWPCKPCHYNAVEPFKLHLMSMSYIYEVFEHPVRVWMGISHHYHHSHFSRFVRVGWNPTWCKCGEMAILFCWQFLLLFVLPALEAFCHFVWGRTFWQMNGFFMPLICKWMG